MLDDFDLSGRVALVTGGNRGIGRGIALGLARAGADIAIAARDEDQTATTVAEVAALGRRAIGVRCDVTRRADLDCAVDRTRSELGSLSILVNNAGASGGGTLPQEVTEEAWDGVMAVNLKAAFLACQAAYPALAERGGKIINISSAQTMMASERLAGYGASKAALEHLTRTLAVTWAPQQIQVNAIVPGAVRTRAIRGILDDPVVLDRVIRHTPAGRIAEPEELGAIAVFLASRASDFMTGQCLHFDGGVTIMTNTALFQRD